MCGMNTLMKYIRECSFSCYVLILQIELEHFTIHHLTVMCKKSYIL